MRLKDDIWLFWERIVVEQGVVIDRPKGTTHPRFAEMIYPVDYGYLAETAGGDGAEIDVFVGSAESGLVGLLVTHDAAKGDREVKLLWNLTENEIESVAAFLNCGTMTAELIRRSDQSAASWNAFFAFRDLIEVPEDFMRERPLNVMLDAKSVFENEI